LTLGIFIIISQFYCIIQIEIIVFISRPFCFIIQVRSKLQHQSAAIQVPIGLEDDFKGLVDLVQLKAYSFHGSNGYVSGTFALVIPMFILQITQLFLIVEKMLLLKKFLQTWIP
jgi:translation elongation factor EF-G